MTGQWEAFLKRIERGKAELDPFIHGIEGYVRDVVGKVGTLPPAPRERREGSPSSAAPSAAPQSSIAAAAVASPPRPVVEIRGEPARIEDLPDILHRTFGFAGFRANQEEVCQAVMRGHDVLLVMPTGAGKSLCYQLPGVALGAGWIPSEDEIRQYDEGQKQGAAAILEAVKAQADGLGVESVLVHVSDSRPADAILQTAAARGTDLIVMASHGRRGVQRLLLGSQTAEVLALAEVPVLVVK